MKKKLLPFKTTETLPGISVLARAEIVSQRLELSFEVVGKAREILWPTLSGAPEPPGRADALWKNTCFEAFLQPEGGTGYHEINLCPSGRWNAYRFTGYRKGMVLEPAISEIKIQSGISEAQATLSCFVDLGAVGVHLPLHLGLSCVIESRSGDLSYWALLHAGRQPDFHDPRGFILKL